MGIPRLSSDVAPYAKTAILGQVPSESSVVEIKKVVIDGPSLIYHVFNALLRNTDSSSIGTAHDTPSYRQINACLNHFLKDLELGGVNVDKIFFDGALPVPKRRVRLERLERTRRNLQEYRKLNTHISVRAQQGSSLVVQGQNAVNDFHRALWDIGVTWNVSKQLLPPPPFMVPGAIEWLQKSDWSDVVEVVPGEADGYVATEAAASGAAILSNDSDFLLYNLGQNGVILLLRSLQPVGPATRHHPGWLKGQCYQLIDLARKLDVSDMLAFGFHRSMDTSSSSAIIAQRARTAISSKEIRDWTRFRAEYRGSRDQALDDKPSATGLQRTVQNLDPRIAEIVCSLCATETAHMYLPMVTEDPSRDSSWSYGYEIRKLAYSILLDFINHDERTNRAPHVIEHARSGIRIVETEVGEMSLRMLTERALALCNSLQFYLAFIRTRSRDDDVDTTSSTMIVLAYHLLAAEQVISLRASRPKPYRSSLFNLFSIIDASVLSWEDIHFHANVQCVLYSLRILKQVTCYVRSQSSPLGKASTGEVIQNLYASLLDMPDISSVFLDPTALQRSSLSIPPRVIKDSMLAIEQGGDPLSRASSGENTTRVVNGQSRDKNGTSSAGVSWHEPKVKRWSRRYGGDRPQEAPHTNFPRATTNPNDRSLNRYMLLYGGESENIE